MDTNYNQAAQAAQGGLQALNKAKPPESRAALFVSRLDVLYSQLREVRGMTFGATERILGSEPTPIRESTGQNAGTTAVPCFMAQVENAIGDIERVVSEIREELGRINRAF